MPERAWPARLLTVVILALAVLCAAEPARAQQYGQLAGSITDQTGAALAGVIVTVRGADTQRAETDGAGHFEFRDLPIGDYELDAQQSASLLPTAASGCDQAIP